MRANTAFAGRGGLSDDRTQVQRTILRCNRPDMSSGRTFVVSEDG
jgi:hypothetical protein